MAAWDQFLFILAAFFFVPMGILFADMFYREYLVKVTTTREAKTEEVSLQLAEQQI